MSVTLDIQETEPDQREARRPCCPEVGVPPDQIPEARRSPEHRPGRAVPGSETRANPDPTYYACSATNLSIGELLSRAARRDPFAWEEITRRYSALVWARVRSFRLQDADAADAVQMTWLRLAENCERVRQPDRLGGWLATTTTRECLRILRQTKQTPQPVDSLVQTLTDPNASPESIVLDAETAQAVRNLVAELSPRWRTLIQAMFDEEPRPYAEISHATGIPIGSLGPTRTRALHQLRHMLNERGLGLPA